VIVPPAAAALPSQRHADGCSHAGWVTRTHGDRTLDTDATNRVHRCRATAPNISPAPRCGYPTGHGRAHMSPGGVYWLGPEPDVVEGEAA
jgi:hypothetical protein